MVTLLLKHFGTASSKPGPTRLTNAASRTLKDDSGSAAHLSSAIPFPGSKARLICKPSLPADTARLAPLDRRVCFLDNLRTFGVAMVVLLHGCMIYMQDADPHWYVHSPQHNPVFTALAAVVDIPAVPILLFIAAYFLLPSLNRRDPKTFLKDKLIRIGIPWLIGVLFLMPPIAYLAYYTRNVPLSFREFLASYFWDDRFQQGSYWFLGFLFFFFVVASTVYYTTSWLRSPPAVLLSPWKVLLGFWAITTLSLVLLGERGFSDGWFIGWRVLIFQPWRLPVDIGYLLLGIIACRLGWFTQDGYRPRLAPWAALWTASGILYLGMYFLGGQFKVIKIVHNLVCNSLIGQTAFTRHLERAVLFNTFCLASLMILAVVFQRYFDRDNRLLALLARNSYGAYYVHPVILYPLAALCLGINFPPFVEATAVICVALFLSWLSSALLLKKVPMLRRVF